jgi:RimJ/RimL family protein N-acetyltransferase
MAGSEPHPETGQLVGLPVDTTPAQRPGPVTLQGRYGRLEKLAEKHAASLWDAIKGDNAIWTYISGGGPFADAAQCAAWLKHRVEQNDPYAYTVVDRDERVVGTATLMNIRPDARVIEVGSIVYAPALQRTPLGTEVQYLLARYAFETLGYRRYEWKCDALNVPSRRAALRYGFTFEFIMRQHMIIHGRNRDTAWFSMLDCDWPTRKANFERWLAPENFTADGQQRSGLSAMNGVAG